MKKYDVIYADPPYKYEHPTSNNRKIEDHYETMSLEEIKNLDIPCKPNSILFLWTPSPKLFEALEIMKAWGFNYRTCLVWDKKSIGMGYWFRQQHEILLVGIKGNFKTPIPQNRISSIWREKRRKHSQKPDGIRRKIDEWYPNETKIELFARKGFQGWDLFGNEVSKYKQHYLFKESDYEQIRVHSERG